MSEPTQEKALALREATPVAPPQMVSPFTTEGAFEAAQRMAKLICSSAMVPEQYQGPDKIGNAVVAMEVASRMNASVLMVMQNLHIIEGRPAWSAPFLVGCVNATGRFSPLKYRYRDLGTKTVGYSYWDGPRGQRVKKQGQMQIQDMGCIAYAKDRSGEVCESPEITIETAVLEGWYNRNGSKWPTMPKVMLAYRAAGFFTRLFCPEVSLGLQTKEEVQDFIDVEAIPADPTPAVTDIPKRTTPAARKPKTVDAVVVDPPPPQDPPPSDPPPQDPPPSDPPPTTRTVASGLPKRKVAANAPNPPPPPPVDPPQPPPAPKGKAAPAPAADSPQGQVQAWLTAQAIKFSELVAALREYGYLDADDAPSGPERFDADTCKFIIENAPTLADNIKGARV